MVRLGLFGTFAVSGDGAPETVRGAIPQAVLARLALTPGDPVSTEQLVHDLWSEPPSTVVSSLRAHISRLRTRGWGGLLSSGHSGYRLAVASDAVDVLRYGRLVERSGDGRVRLDDLAEAERLWVGPPLASLREFPFARSVADRLTRSRRDATLELGELRIAHGDAALAATVLGAFVVDHPHDAAAVALLARALARSGRTADAVELIDAHVAAEEADGRTPLDDVTRTRLAIVRQDPLILGTGVADRPERTVERFGIPIPLTRFIGRTRELDAVRRGRSESRLVTLTGAAGVGKTRLAVEVARRAGPDEDETQRLIDLAAISAPAQVLGAVADAVAATEHSVEAVARMLAGRRSLVVLDNAEHVLGATAALCAALLERCDGLSVLVTSREAMRMAGERVIVVEPLLGDAVGDAVTLFLQRATDSSGISDWSDAQVDRVRALCRTLDGLPLAIELAASRLDVLSVDELAASLDDPGGPHGGTRHERGRHDSIDDAISWSTRLTSGAERAVLAQLVCFAGPFTLDAVAGICTADGADPRELTVSLARRSLVSALAAESGERRFRVLEAVKHHVRAADPLPDAAGWHRRHDAWLVETAERLLPALRSADAKRVKATLGAWRADLDDALKRMIAGGDRDGAVRLVAALAWYWYERGLGADAVGQIERALAVPGPPMPDAEARALHAAAFMRSVGTEPLETVRMTRRFAAAADAAEDPTLPMLAHVMLAYIAAGADDPEEAEAELARSAEARARVSDPRHPLLAEELLVRGDALRLLGRPAQALDVLAESYRLASELGHIWALKGACFVTGKVLTSVGRARDAVAILRTGAVKSLESGDVTSAFAAVNAAAAAFVRLDDAARAAELYAAVDVLGERFAFHFEGSDAAYTETARAAARSALTPAEWDAAYSRGAGLDLRGVMELLVVR